jgi:membrane associated rhomboid family serine protease
MPSPFEDAPVTKWLLIINLAILFLQVLMTGTGERLEDSSFYTWGSFSIQKALYEFQFWRFLTFQFLHAGFLHLTMNCFGLFIFGPHIERWMTSRAYLTFYLLCGVAGVLFYTLLFYTPGILGGYYPAVPMVGASAGLFGILAAFYFVAPEARLLLFFVIPVKMKNLALGYFIYESLSVILNWHNAGGSAGGSAGHLGGALFGIAVLKWPPLKKWVVKISQIAVTPPTKSKRPTRDATIVREESHSPLELTNEVNRILDKISEEGIQSLTPKERETLNKARKDK